MTTMEGTAQRCVVSTRAGKLKARVGGLIRAGGGMAWLWDEGKGTGSRGAVGRPDHTRLRVKVAGEEILIGRRGGGARKREMFEGGMGVVRGWRRAWLRLCGEGMGG